MKLLLASSNPGKLREYRELAGDSHIDLAELPNFREITEFEESAPTFAENAAGKAQYYSRFAGESVLADDSGLLVPSLGGAPGVHSARYAGPYATDRERIDKLLREMKGKKGDERRAVLVQLALWSVPGSKKNCGLSWLLGLAIKQKYVATAAPL